MKKAQRMNIEPYNLILLTKLTSRTIGRIDDFIITISLCILAP